MDHYRAVALAEGWEDGLQEEILEAWQYLIDSGFAWTLQGWFGRNAQQLIEAGVCEPAPQPEEHEYNVRP